MQKFTAAPESQGYNQQQARQGFESEGYQQSQQAEQAEPETQQPAAGSFTTRFQAQSAQRVPTSFGSVMAGNATGMYQPVAATSRYQSVQQ